MNIGWGLLVIDQMTTSIIIDNILICSGEEMMSIQCENRGPKQVNKISLQLEPAPKAVKGRNKAAAYCSTKFKKKTVNERTREQIIAEKFHDSLDCSGDGRPSRRTSSAFYPKNNKALILSNHCVGEANECDSGCKSCEMIAQRNLVFLNNQQLTTVKKLARHQNLRGSHKLRTSVEEDRLRRRTEPVNWELGPVNNSQTTIDGSDSQLRSNQSSTLARSAYNSHENSETYNKRASTSPKPQQRQIYPTSMINMSEYRTSGNGSDINKLTMEESYRPMLPVCKKITYQNVNKFYELCIKTIENTKKNNKQDIEANNQPQNRSKTQYIISESDDPSRHDTPMLYDCRKCPSKGLDLSNASIIDYYNFLNKSNKANEIKISTQMTILPSRPNTQEIGRNTYTLKGESSLLIKKKLLDHKQHGDRVNCQQVTKKLSNNKRLVKSNYHYSTGYKGRSKKLEEDYVVKGWDTYQKETPNFEDAHHQ